MALTLDFHPEAEIELDEAIEWYEELREGLGFKFFEEYLAIKDIILANPQIYPLEFEEVRKATFKKFPYILLYFVWDELIYVVAIFHSSQDPETWKRRVEKL